MPFLMQLSHKSNNTIAIAIDGIVVIAGLLAAYY